jgi:predicted permease
MNRDRDIRPGIRRAFLLALPWRRRVQGELIDELELHVDLRARQLQATGMTADDARAEALRRLGFTSMDEARERLAAEGARIARPLRLRDVMDSVSTDSLLAVRQLRRQPGFAIAVVATLGIALAAAATMFGVVDRLLLRPPAGVAAPDQVRRFFVTYTWPAGDGRPAGSRSIAGVDWEYYQKLRRELPAVSIAAAKQQTVPVGTGAAARRGEVRFVSPGWFALLGARPALGRLISDDEAELRSGARVVVLGYGAWRRHFGGDESAVGRRIDIDGRAHTVIGVAPRDFNGADLTAVDAYLPMASALLDPDGRWSFELANAHFNLVARLATGSSDLELGSRADAVFHAYAEERRRPGDTRPRSSGRVTAVPLGGGVGSDLKRMPEASVSIWLVGVSVVLVLVACANVASLFLLRAERRRRELAVRLALGVSRGRLVAQLLVESLVVAVLGGVLAVVLTAWGGVALRRLLLPNVDWEFSRIDTRVVALTALGVVATALIAGILPALRAWRADGRSVMSGVGQTGAGGSLRQIGAQRGLLVLQTALSTLLLVGAGLFLRSLHNLRSIDIGMEPARVVAVGGDFGGAGWKTPEIESFFARAVERLEALPSVEQVSLASGIPLMSARGMGLKAIAGRDSAVVRNAPSPMGNHVDPDFFSTMGMRIVSRRGIDARDVRGAPLVAVINETLARQHWSAANESPIGACLRLGNIKECVTVVGVVRDARLFFKARDAEIRPQLYMAIRQKTFVSAPEAILVRTTGDDAERHTGRVRDALQGLMPGMPFLDVRSVQSAIEPEVRPWQLGATVFTLYGAFAVLLAALGLYSATAYAVAARTREIGVRIAVGARAADVIRLVLGEGMRVGVLGLALGLSIAAIGGAGLTDLLFEVGPRDGTVLGAVAVVLLGAVTVASLIPARRAARVDPVVSLRTE